MGEQRAVAFQPGLPHVSVVGATARSEPRVGVTARARFVVDPADVATAIEGRLWAAARLEAITEDKVADYCRARGLLHRRLELALLREAHTIVPPAQVIDRLVVDVEHYLRRPGNGELSLLVNGSGNAGRVDGACNVSGTLSLCGSLSLPADGADGNDYRVETNWHVVRGEARSAFTERASSLFAEPLASAVGIVAGRALADVDRALPLVERAALQNPSTPVFARLERLLRMGRLTHESRVLLLYWKRLRDYLIWDVTR